MKVIRIVGSLYKFPVFPHFLEEKVLFNTTALIFLVNRTNGIRYDSLE